MNTAIVTMIQTPATEQATDQFEAQRALRNAFVRAWRADPKQNAAAHAAYAMIRGKSLDKTFSPITNPNKLACNASNPHSGRDEACASAQSGSRHAWGWAADALKEAGLEPDRYGRYPCKEHALIGAWMAQATTELA